MRRTWTARFGEHAPTSAHTRLRLLFTIPPTDRRPYIRVTIHSRTGPPLDRLLKGANATASRDQRWRLSTSLAGHLHKPLSGIDSSASIHSMPIDTKRRRLLGAL